MVIIQFRIILLFRFFLVSILLNFEIRLWAIVEYKKNGKITFVESENRY